MVAVRALLFAAAIAASHIPSPTRAHGAMLNPPPRNAIDSTIPGADWGDGQNHGAPRAARRLLPERHRALPAGAVRLLVLPGAHPHDNAMLC
jgi:hypothetical protein